MKICSNQKFLILITIFLLILFSYIFYYNNIYLGDYIIKDQWIGSENNNYTYCNNCLWIRFDEGCNRYKTYYFENQHEFDNRLKIGNVVNIDFDGTRINGINLAYKYRTKCFYELDHNFYFVVAGIIVIFTIILLFLTKTEQMKHYLTSQASLELKKEMGG